MYEKVNPAHPDKVADRIAGAIVDHAYRLTKDPRIAVEVLIGHELCTIITETSETIAPEAVENIVQRIAGEEYSVVYLETQQDTHLAENQHGKARCGDNGIFKGAPVTDEQQKLTTAAKKLFAKYPTDGKSVLDDERLIICQSNAAADEIRKLYPGAEVNPLGDWTGGPGVDTGATNRKLGSDMGDGVTGGGLHGKDLTKADVSVNIYAFLQAQKTGRPVMYSCAIGDEEISGVKYEQIMNTAKKYIEEIGGFEKLAEWGLIR